MMQENYISGFWHKTALTAAAVCVSASIASAAEAFPNGGTILANTEYSLLSQEMSGVFYPSTTGQIIYNCGNGFHAYSDASHSNMITGEWLNFTDGGTYSLDVTKDVPVYFYCSDFDARFQLTTGLTFTVSENQPIAVTGYTVQPGSTLSMTDGLGEVDIYFNQPVHAGTVTLSIDGTSNTTVINTGTANSTTLAVPYLTQLQNWFNTGALQGGEGLTMTISGIQNASGVYYNGGEDLVLKFKAPQKTVSLRNYSGANPFYSYWTPGDPSAVLTANYSGNISRADYMITFGDFENSDGNGYVEEGSSQNPSSPAKVTIDGNVVKVDFAGKQRRPTDMVSSGTNYNNLVIKITAWDADGNPIASVGQGTVGSFEIVPTYIYLDPAQLNAVFTPEAGTTLKGQSDITINLYDYDKIDFSGVKFEIETGQPGSGVYQTVIVPKSDVTVTSKNNNNWDLKIPVPAEAQKGSGKVIVTLDNLTSTDGEDHTLDVRAVYDGFTITVFEFYDPNHQLITDRVLSELQEGTEILVIPNVSSEYPNLYMEYAIEEVDGDNISTIKSPVWLNKEDDGFDIVYTQTLTMPIKMVLGHEYRFVFTAWASEMDANYGAAPLGVEYYVFKGSTPAFTFSNITFEGSTPADGTEIEPTQTEFTLTYSGLVQISDETSHIVYGQGMTVPFSSIKPVIEEGDENSGYSNTWIVTIPDSYIASYGADAVDLAIVAVDEDGKLIEGNTGEEENNYLSLHFPVAGAGTTDDFYVLPSDEYVSSLETFTIGMEGKQTGLTYIDDAFIVLYDRTNMREIYTFSNNDMEVHYAQMTDNIPAGVEEGDDRYYRSYYTFSLPSPITDPGSYSLNIPQGFFTFGSQFDTSVNAVRVMTYGIKGEAAPVEYTVVPAEGKVEELETITITFTEDTALGNGAPSLIINGEAPIRLNDAEAVWPDDFFDPIVEYIQTLPQKYTEIATYEIVYPEGYFQSAEGDAYPQITLTYAIGQVGIDALFGDAESVNVFSLDGRQLVSDGTADDLKTLEAGIYVINGRKVVIRK
ncbi:MAG: hypothetical protein HDS31_00730 [Bacteroides sp.]|nr:hypothetical protein [Bacteroides sp.]